MYSSDNASRLTAVEAKSWAQALAFGPFAFHAARAMRDLGVLEQLDDAGKSGLPLEDVARRCGLSRYAASVLLDMGVHLGLAYQAQERWFLGKVGYFILHDEMTRVNFDFTGDVCCQALPFLSESLLQGKPAGLHTLGPWPLLYDGLSALPEPARRSWFAFDHFYSDHVFQEMLPIVFDRPVDRLMDVGGNTGRWAVQCLEHDEAVNVLLVDLPLQIRRAREELSAHPAHARLEFLERDVLSSDCVLPGDSDVIWMSQFLDCFSAEQIVSILRLARGAMTDDTRLFITELFPDRQRHEAAAFSLDAISLYFTCVASGHSRMYHHDEFCTLLESAGLVVEQQWDHVGIGHSVVCCRTS